MRNGGHAHRKVCEKMEEKRSVSTGDVAGAQSGGLAASLSTVAAVTEQS